MNITSDSSDNIVHESLDERQYIRVKIPAIVTLYNDTIGPFECKITDISLGGIGIECGYPAPVGTILQASVKLRLGALDLSIDTMAKIVSHRNTAIGLQFIDLSPQKRDIIRYIISSYMSGEIADVNGLFNVMQRENYIKERKKQTISFRSIGERFRAIFGTIIFATIGLLAICFVAYKLYILFLRVPIESALVSADAYILTMPESGNLNYLIKSGQTSVRAGDPIANISTQLSTRFSTPGDIAVLSNLSTSDVQLLLNRTAVETVINSPCDGDLYFPTPPLNGFFYKGNLLAELLPKETAFFVKVNIPYEKMPDANRIKSITLTVYGDTEPMKGEVISATVNEQEHLIVLRVRPERPLSKDSYRNSVYVELFLTMPSLTTPFSL
jgi:PilZ domain.